jgi:predicted HAD superfamily Cof-like phosphohydrolase
MNLIEKIKSWAKTFGLPVRSIPTYVSYNDAMFNHILLQEEVDELEQAISERDLIQMADAYGDILWLTIRGMQAHGIDPTYIINQIYESNMTKLITNEEQVNYEISVMDKSFKIRKIESGWVILDLAGKVRKPSTYEAPNFSDIMGGGHFKED